MYVHIPHYLPAYLPTYLHYMHACIHAYVHTYIHAYIRTCIHAYIPSCQGTYLSSVRIRDMCVFTHTLVYMILHLYSNTQYTYTHSYTYTHMHIPSLHVNKKDLQMRHIQYTCICTNRFLRHVFCFFGVFLVSGRDSQATETAQPPLGPEREGGRRPWQKAECLPGTLCSSVGRNHT